jgi:hypothetical protein
MNEIKNYNSMHRKIVRERGSAKEYLCIDCTERNAHHWSLRNGADYTIQVGTKWEGRMFSNDIEDYEPRCGKCHSAHDRAHGLQKAPTGIRKTPHKERPDCTIEDCDKPNKAHGRCDTHYAALRREEKRESMEIIDCRTTEQKITADVMDYIEGLVNEHGVDPAKVLGQVSYKCKRIIKELKEN